MFLSNTNNLYTILSFHLIISFENNHVFVYGFNKVTVIQIVIGALGTVTKRLVKGLEDLEITGRVETIQTTPLLRSTRLLRRVLETRGDLLSLSRKWTRRHEFKS